MPSNEQMHDLAYCAGAAGKNLPDFGAPLPPAVLKLINEAYDKGRNEHAACSRGRG